jgi:hypothetical protein
MIEQSSGLKIRRLSRVRSAGLRVARWTAYFAASFAVTAGVFVLAHI